MARVLIVDDSPTETYRFKEILERNGHVALEATNGADTQPPSKPLRDAAHFNRAIQTFTRHHG